MKIKNYNFFFNIYLSGTIILVLPLIILSFIKHNITFFNILINYCSFKISIITIIILSITTLSFFIYDIYFNNNFNQIKKNIYLINNIFGLKKTILKVTLISLFSGIFEELLFRLYIYNLILLLIKNFINLNIYSNTLIILLISIIFGLLHIIQGKAATLISFIFSIIFIITMIISNTIYYAIFFHGIFNFIEFMFILPYQEKKLKIQ